MTMAHPSVDLVEEDAADLQFPKGKQIIQDFEVRKERFLFSFWILCNFQQLFQQIALNFLINHQ